MPFDATLPTNNAQVFATVLRVQFNGLFDLIQAIPAGPQGILGMPGVQGPPFAQAIMDAVNTLNPGDPAQAAVSFDGTNVHFTFGIPRGNDGVRSPPVTSFIVDGVNTLNPGDNATVQATFDGTSVRLVFGIPRGNDGTVGVNGQDGQNGINGQDGGIGPTGLQGVPGPPFTNFVVDTVSTLPAGDPATAQAMFDGSAVKLSFGIPKGEDGVNGLAGQDGQLGGIGPQGLQGLQGPSFADAIVDNVTTLNPGDNATAQTAFDGSHVRFTFGLPRGFNGTNGLDGGTGATGPQGAPFATALVDGVTMLNPGDNATVQTFFDGMNVHFTFGIPRGQDGLMGPQGIQGPPGNVNVTDLANAITGTSSNSNLVATLDTPFANDPPSLADLEAMRAKVNELIGALRR